MKIIDNFLPEYQFNQLQSFVFGGDWQWFYNDYICVGDNRFQFTTGIFKAGCELPPYPFIEPCIPLLKVKRLYRIKANLNPRTLFHRSGGYHTDRCPCPYTGILYINTNNGWTHIKRNAKVPSSSSVKVKSVANRMVIFDSRLEHAGYTCTDEKVRVFVNFNWE